MKNEVELKIAADGSIEGIYQDGLADALGAETKEVRRVSNVEFETIDGRSGWVVRSTRDSQLAIRANPLSPNYYTVSRNKDLRLITFPTREEALAEEVKLFWGLVEGR